jgi:phage FluMu protein gp41
MRLEDIIKQIENVSKKEIKRVVPVHCLEIKKIIMESSPADMYEKMVVGYLTSLCAEYMNPEPFHLEQDGIDYIGFELDGGTIIVGTAGNMLGTCMKSGKIAAKKAGEGTGSSMTGGEIIADEIKSIGNTIEGRISTKKVDKISKVQGAEIFINGVKFRRGLFNRLFGK